MAMKVSLSTAHTVAILSFCEDGEIEPSASCLDAARILGHSDPSTKLRLYAPWTRPDDLVGCTDIAFTRRFKGVGSASTTSWWGACRRAGLDDSPLTKP
jgi:hypothetical protein